MKCIKSFSKLNENKQILNTVFSKDMVAKQAISDMIGSGGSLKISIKYQSPLEYIDYCARKLKKSVFQLINTTKNNTDKWKLYKYANLMLSLQYPDVTEYKDNVELAIKKINTDSTVKNPYQAFPPPSFGVINKVDFVYDGLLRALAAIIAGLDIIPVYYFTINNNKNKK